MQQFTKQQQIIGGVLVVLILLIGGIIWSRQSASKNTADSDTVFEEPSEIIPTVDASVKVSIEGNTEAVITVEGVPDGTKEIEYELTYNKKNLVEDEGLQDGLLGRIQVKNNEKKVEEDITFGTCSSGVCRYHDIDGEVKGTFKFSGSYGERLLEKSFTLK
ncbi:MAG: hypothetical protein ACEQSA_02855 [Weeksellaceae bacterium]